MKFSVVGVTLACLAMQGRAQNCASNAEAFRHCVERSVELCGLFMARLADLAVCRRHPLDTPRSLIARRHNRLTAPSGAQLLGSRRNGVPESLRRHRYRTGRVATLPTWRNW